MALNFFDYDQLARGAHEGEEQDRHASPSNDTRPQLESKGGSLRMNVPQLRKLLSETNLRSRPLSSQSIQDPASSSRPATSGATRRQQKSGPLSSNPLRPETAQSRRTDVSGDGRSKSFTQRSLHKIRLVASKSQSKDGPQDEERNSPTRPKSGGQESGKDVKRTRRKSWKEKQTDGQPRTERSRANTMRDKASNILQQLTTLAASKPDQHVPQPAAKVAKTILNNMQAQFLAESLAHVTVGEWLFKDHNRPSLIPRSNPLKRQVGPPPRGSTGLPQRRWFRISPYDRKVMWSSKWDASSLDQLKSNRQVPVNLVFETTANQLFNECLPSANIPFKRSIVIVAPQRVVKITAPDEERHRLWLTALQYIAASTVKLDEERWAAELRARFEVLSVNDLSFPPQHDTRVSGGIVDVTVPNSKHISSNKHVSSNLYEEKPLPPSPPRSTVSRSTQPAMTPPGVPRWSKHGKQRSEGVSTMADTSSDFHLPSRGSGDEPVPTLDLPQLQIGQHSLDLEEQERERATRTRESEMSMGGMPRQSEAQETDVIERGREEGTKSHTESRRMSSDEFAVDQLEMLVDRLGQL